MVSKIKDFEQYCKKEIARLEDQSLKAALKMQVSKEMNNNQIRALKKEKIVAKEDPQPPA